MNYEPNNTEIDNNNPELESSLIHDEAQQNEDRYCL